MATNNNKDVVLGAGLVLSVVSLVLLFGVTWYFQSSLDLLQQQVQYDREMLLKLQNQIQLYSNILNGDHAIGRRQSAEQCTCKDGAQGPIGPPGKRGKKGDQGVPGEDGIKGDKGPRGDVGDRGPRGSIGDQGYPGPAGEKGEKGIQGPQGDPGQRGRKGIKGERGYAGLKGDNGDMGSRGIHGLQGETGQPGRKGIKGEMGYTGLKGDKGDMGSRGLIGLAGPKGATGTKGDKNGGVVYVRWGHDQCPSTAKLVYKGRAGGSAYSETGGGSNPQCLPEDPEYLDEPTLPRMYAARIHGAEYETQSSRLKRVHNHDIPCAVCYVSDRSAVYTVPAKYTCPDGTWTREYYGYLMAGLWKHNRVQFICVDVALKTIKGLANESGSMLLYPVESKCTGSLPCPPYGKIIDLNCAVCSK